MENIHDDISKKRQNPILVHLTDFRAILVRGLMIFEADFWKSEQKIVSPRTKITLKSVRWSKI